MDLLINYDRKLDYIILKKKIPIFIRSIISLIKYGK